MGTSKLTEKLEKFFYLSKSKQLKKQDKLLKIIGKLEEKKLDLEKKVVMESEIDETSDTYHDLRQELTVVSKLLKKAKKKRLLDTSE